MCCLAEQLLSSWEKSYGKALRWIKAQLFLAIYSSLQICVALGMVADNLAQVLMVELDSQPAVTPFELIQFIQPLHSCVTGDDPTWWFLPDWF